MKSLEVSVRCGYLEPHLNACDTSLCTMHFEFRGTCDRLCDEPPLFRWITG